jgi:hypothetical protein
VVLRAAYAAAAGGDDTVRITLQPGQLGSEVISRGQSDVHERVTGSVL